MATTSDKNKTNLSKHINQFLIINIDKHKSTISANELISNKQIAHNSHIISEVDEELLILIQFTKIINLQRIELFECSNHKNDALRDASAPKEIRVYKIKHTNINFQDIQSINPDHSSVLKQKKSKNVILHKLNLQKNPQNAVKFKTIKCLAIYIPSNQLNTEKTYLNGIKLLGTVDEKNQCNQMLIEEKKTNPVQNEKSKPRFMIEWMRNNVDENCRDVSTATLSALIATVCRSSALLKNKQLFEGMCTLDECTNILTHASGSIDKISTFIYNNPEKLSALKEFCKKFKAFKLGENPSLSDIKKCIESIIKKNKSLMKDCSDQAFREQLNSIHAQYIAASTVLLCVSFALIYSSFLQLEETTEMMEEYREKLNKLYVETILPTLQYKDKLTKHETVYDLCEYQGYCEKIDHGLEMLNEYKSKIESEKTKCKQVGYGNAICAAVMLFLAVYSFTNPVNAGVFIVGCGQTIASVLHVKVAYDARKLYFKLCEFQTELQKYTKQLKDGKLELERWKDDNYSIDEQKEFDDLSLNASEWSNEKVIEWSRKLGDNYRFFLKIVVKKRMTGPELLQMTKPKLEALGVDKLHKRKQLMRRILKLQTHQ
eukprot:105289_1